MIGDPGYPDDPVHNRITYYEQQHDRYAFEQIILLAILTSVRPENTSVPSWMIRTILDTAASILTKLIAMGKEPMICSELEYRCFNEAGDKYSLHIKGADFIKSPDSLYKSLQLATSETSEVVSVEEEYNTLNSKAEIFLERYAECKNRIHIPEHISESGDMPVSANVNLKSLAAALAVADFVTPCDLKKCPNLFLVGRLK